MGLKPWTGAIGYPRSGGRARAPGALPRCRALEVEVKELTEEKMQVRVEWRDENDKSFEEQLQFTGEELDFYDGGDVTYTLFECPGGYRVHEKDSSVGTASLHPYDPSIVVPYHRFFTAQEVAEEYPVFARAVGVMRVRDID